MATTPAILNVRIQQQFVAIGTVDAKGNVFITNVWRRPLEDMANVVNTLQSQVATLQARLAAAGIP